MRFPTDIIVHCETNKKGTAVKLTGHSELIRCRDCKHRDPEDKKCDCGHFIMWQTPRDDDWYCADGERKEE